MLVLSRKSGEHLTLTVAGKRLALVKVIEINGNKVRLGLEADKEVEIDRAEVDEAKRKVI